MAAQVLDWIQRIKNTN